MRRVFYRAFLALGFGVLPAWGAEQPVMPSLARVVTKAGKSYVGELVKESAAMISLRLLDTGKVAEYKKAGQAKVETGISESDAARYAGMPLILAWKVGALAARTTAVGKVAKVNPNFVYLTLGSDTGAAVGQELNAFRNSGDVIDPDTKKVLASDRHKIAKVQVTEVAKNYSKAKMLGELESPLEIGDEVEFPSNTIRVAVFPIADQGGKDAGTALAEQCTTALVAKGIDVVDRSLLKSALVELAIQQTALFDEKTAQSVGKQLGATVVLAGKIVANGNRREAHLRLIQVSTGTILLAMSQPLSASGGSTSSAGGTSGGSESADVKDWFQLGGKSRWPAFLQGSDAGVILKEGFSVRHGKAGHTKQADFLNRDFVFEVVYSFPHESSLAPAYQVMFAGIGETDASSSAPEKYVEFCHWPPTGFTKGQVAVCKKGGGNVEQKMGNVGKFGPHLLRIEKSGGGVTFTLDVDNDGKSSDDLELMIPDLHGYAPLFHEKNSYLVFGGGDVVFQKVRLTVDP